MKRKTAMRLIKAELDLAQDAHDPLHSPHEGFAVIREELDELWGEVKSSNGTTHRGLSEAVQVAAMALRYLVDLCDEETAAQHEAKVQRWRYTSDHIHLSTSGGCYSG